MERYFEKLWVAKYRIELTTEMKLTMEMDFNIVVVVI